MDFLIRDCILCPITPHDVLVHSSPVRKPCTIQEEEQTFYKKDEKMILFLVY